ncbi:MAG: hypothetical protein K2Z80_23625 [Xanthobacteraceae bacterium]|nr:hypothetical protein [Xanthobacteraceae bacterium]
MIIGIFAAIGLALLQMGSTWLNVGRGGWDFLHGIAAAAAAILILPIGLILAVVRAVRPGTRR